MNNCLTLSSIVVFVSLTACSGGGPGPDEPEPPTPTTWIVTGTLLPPEGGRGEEGDPPPFGPIDCGPIGLESLTMTFTPVPLPPEDEPRFDGFWVETGALDTQGLASHERSTIFAVVDTQPNEANINLFFGGVYYDASRDQTVVLDMHFVPGVTSSIDTNAFSVEVEFDIYAGDQRVLVDHGDGDGSSTEVPEDLFPDCSGAMLLQGVRAGSGGGLLDDTALPIVLAGDAPGASITAAWFPSGELRLAVEFADGSRATAIAGMSSTGVIANRRGSAVGLRGMVSDGGIDLILVDPAARLHEPSRVLLAPAN